jgi:iron complex outermembrane recepter protein
MKKMTFAAALLASTSPIMWAVPAMAQEAPAARGVNDDGDIIVTAQRRDESLSKTPVSVAVISADTLAKAQVVSEQDLRIATPGLSVRAGLNSNQLNYSLRGQSQDAFAGTRPGVLPYINEVQIGGSGGSSAFYDLQSVQVLKGPQGTLFGRSATGGAVLFTTAKPTEEFSGYASALGGNYGAMKFEGAVSGPIAGEALLGRVAGFYQERNGQQFNLYDGGREGDMKRTGVRGSLTAQLGSSVKNELVVDYLHSNSESMVGVISGLLPFTGGGAPFIPIEFLYAGTATPIGQATGIGTAQAFLAAAGPGVQALVPGFYNAYFADPKHPNGGIRAFLNTQNARGPYVISSDASNTFKANNLIVTNITTIDLGANTRIRNVFGYTHLKSSTAFEADGTPYGISQNDSKGSPKAYDDLTEQVSEELQLQGEAAGDKLTYVVGGYYSGEKTTAGHPSEFFDLLLGGQNGGNFFVAKNTTLAGYAQGTYKLNDAGLSVTVGGRYTSEKARLIILAADDDAASCGLVGFSCDQSKRFNKISWTFGLQNQFDSGLLLYAATRRSQKSGGFNANVQPKIGLGDVAGNGYQAERVTDVELGAKYQGILGSSPVRLNLALYNAWCKLCQRAGFGTVLGNPSSVTVNVDTKTYGLEFDGMIKPADWLTLGTTFNYTHAKFANTPISVIGILEVYDQVPDTPKTSGTFFADIAVPVSDNINVLLHGDVYHQTKSTISPRSANFAGTGIAGYSLANFRVGLEDQEKGWSLMANLKNAFDKTTYVGGLQTGEIYQINTLVPGERRTWTVEARFKF